MVRKCGMETQALNSVWVNYHNWLCCWPATIYWWLNRTKPLILLCYNSLPCGTEYYLGGGGGGGGGGSQEAAGIRPTSKKKK